MKDIVMTGLTLLVVVWLMVIVGIMLLMVRMRKED